VWSENKFYMLRCNVAFEKKGGNRDAKTLLWHLGCWPEPIKTSPAKCLFCKGGFLEISDEDWT